MTGILCPNAISVIHHIDKNPTNYVHSFYRKKKYKQTYAHMMGGLNSKKIWSKKKVDPPQPPLDIRLHERPTKNKRKEDGEENNRHKMSRKLRKMTCQLCYQIGHNKKTCLVGKKASQNSSQ